MATSNPTPTDANVQAFSIEQNKALWGEIAENVKESRLLERYIVIGMAAYWAFLIKDGKVPLTRQNYLEWILIPALLALLGGLRSMALLSRLTLIGSYLRGMESSMGYNLCLRKTYVLTHEINCAKYRVRSARTISLNSRDAV